MKYIHLSLLILLSFIISFTFSSIGIILPWLFGSMLSTFLYIRFVTKNFYFPKWLGNTGVFIIGFEIGTQFTADAVQEMWGQAFSIFLMTICVLGLSLILSVFFMKMTGCTVETALLSSIPGALSQMVLLAEENKRADILLVTITQMSRIILVIILVPVIAGFFETDISRTLIDKTAPLLTEVFTLDMLWILALAIFIMLVLNKLNFPVPFMLGPMIAMVIWNMGSGQPFSLNMEFMYAAQILLGIRMGNQVSSLLYQLNGRLIISMVIQSVLLILGTLGLVGLFQIFMDSEFNDLFLSAAPGGIGQLIVVAIEIGADVAMISSYHIFRIFFIILIVVPLINYILSKRNSVQ